MPREWTPHEDLVFLKLLKTKQLPEACRELARPETAGEMRLLFLNDHEVVCGAEGAMTHRRRVGRHDESSFVGAVVKDPAPYRSARGQEVMNAIIEPIVSFDRIRSKRAKEQ